MWKDYLDIVSGVNISVSGLWRYAPLLVARRKYYLYLPPCACVVTNHNYATLNCVCTIDVIEDYNV